MTTTTPASTTQRPAGHRQHDQADRQQRERRQRARLLEREVADVERGFVGRQRRRPGDHAGRDREPQHSPQEARPDQVDLGRQRQEERRACRC